MERQIDSLAQELAGHDPPGEGYLDKAGPPGRGPSLALGTTLIAIAIAYFAKLQHFSLYTGWQMFSGAVAFALAFLCFLAAIIAGAPGFAGPDFLTSKSR